MVRPQLLHNISKFLMGSSVLNLFVDLNESSQIGIVLNRYGPKPILLSLRAQAHVERLT